MRCYVRCNIFMILMQSMEKQNQAKARVSANQAKHAFAHFKNKLKGFGPWLTFNALFLL